MRISIIGGGTVGEEARETAVAAGRIVAQRGHTVVCGGLGGVMEAACRGAKEAGGDTVGILPTERRADANDYVDIAVATGLGHARNGLVVMNGDGVIAIDGAGGTLSEVGFSLVFDRPIAGLGTHDVPGVEACETPEEAVRYVEDELGV
ncbi:TIGR00725 family protein [Halogeometricum luteum]|uniref:TIGR00725 family protein n=1 Tax=Halogeometricum luteum TaxID=2950537 RepID=A0ABU2FVW3_9EURY|nr:TIGR00725 family protein [Halogeometricum sp. S3BR5-2]MDS0292664.1 TIGR00725 family protein [Halogeometricum sp. S3BR5-2]